VIQTVDGVLLQLHHKEVVFHKLILLFVSLQIGPKMLLPVPQLVFFYSFPILIFPLFKIFSLSFFLFLLYL